MIHSHSYLQTVLIHNYSYLLTSLIHSQISTDSIYP